MTRTALTVSCTLGGTMGSYGMAPTTYKSLALLLCT